MTDLRDSPQRRGPHFTLYADDPLAWMLVKCWAGLCEVYDLHDQHTIYAARQLAADMEKWRNRNCGKSP